MIVSGLRARRFTCTVDTNPGMVQYMTEVVSDGMRTWRVRVRYFIKPFAGREVAARRILDSLTVVGN